MCNFTPVSNALIALGVLVGWADSSAWFAYAWSDYPFIGAISYSIAVAACIASMVAAGFAISNASAFCRCVAAVRACATACASLTPALAGVMLSLVLLLSACIRGLAGLNDETELVLIFLTTVALAVATVYITSLAVTLARCQSRG